MNLIDTTDQLIIQQLQKDCRQTLKEIGDKVGLSTTPVHERIKKLENLGVITGYSAVVSGKKAGYSLTILLSVVLKEHTKEKIALFETAISSWPEVRECYHIAGNSDYILKIIVKNIEDYYEFINNRVSLLENVIQQLRSSFVLNQVKNETGIPYKKE